jgi:hypothetical protein
MKKLTLTLICFLTLNFAVLAQSNFDRGFKSGFNNGYCYSNQSSVYCTPPLPPTPPLPQINESRNSYQDGYNQGMWYGQNQRKKDEYNSSNSAVKSNPPKFNPYVSQSPILNLSPQEREAYYAAKARQDQARAMQDQAAAEAAVLLLQTVFTVDPQKKKKRQEARNIERLPHLDKKIERELNKIKKQIKKSEMRAAKGKKPKI